MEGYIKINGRVPLWEKVNLTVSEASEVFGIGEKTIRKIIIEESPGDIFFRVGNKYLIRRKQFEDYLLNVYKI